MNNKSKFFIIVGFLLIIILLSYPFIFNEEEVEDLEKDTNTDLNDIHEEINQEIHEEIEEEIEYDEFCLSIINNDLDSCEIFSNTTLDKDNCIRDIIINNLDKYDCSQIEDIQLNQICNSKKNSDVEICEDEIKPICKSIVNKDINDCNEYSSNVEILECNNIYYTLNINSLQDCNNLKKVEIDENVPIDWQKICKAKITKNSTYCELTI